MRQHAGSALIRQKVVTQSGAGRNGTGQNAETSLGELVIPADVVGPAVLMSNGWVVVTRRMDSAPCSTFPSGRNHQDHAHRSRCMTMLHAPQCMK